MAIHTYTYTFTDTLSLSLSLSVGRDYYPILCIWNGIPQLVISMMGCMWV